MNFQFAYTYNPILIANQRLISYYAKQIEYLRFLVIDEILEAEIELLQQKDAKKVNFDINDPNKYKMLEDTTKYHPLALELYKVEKHLQPYYNNQCCKLTTEIQLLAAKGEMLLRLSRARIIGFNKKLEKLSSHREYEKTIYELTIASQFLSHGHHVRFIDTSTKKSADILIDDNIEIECKSKDIVHPYYRKYRDLWYSIMMTKVPEWMERMHINYLISLVFNKEIDRNSIKFIKNKIHDIIYKRRSGKFPIDNERAVINAKELFPYDHVIDEPLTDERYPEIMKDIPVDFDFMQQINTVYPTTQKILQKNFKFVAMKIPGHSKRSIISNLKDAANQFNKSLPSIIYVDISYITRGMKIVDLDNLRVHVDKFLKANSSINAVVITNAYVTEINGVPEAKNGIWVIYNPYAKQILPVGFSIPNEINSAEESLISSKYLDLE